MTDAAIAIAAEPVFKEIEDDAPSRWASLGADLRFFAICYLAGLIVFLVMLS